MTKYIDDTVIMKRMKSRLRKNKIWKSDILPSYFFCFINPRCINCKNNLSRSGIFKLGFL